MDALPEALLPIQRVSFMEDLSDLWAYLLQPFCPVLQSLRLQVQWSHDNTTFFVKEVQKGSVSPTQPSATPTSYSWIGHAYVDRARFFQVHTFVEHISSRSATCFHKTELERKRRRSILQSTFFFKRKNGRARESERASMTGESSHARFGWLRFITERNLPSPIFYRAGAKDLENAIYSPQLFLLRKKDVERAQFRDRVVEKI